MDFLLNRCRAANRLHLEWMGSTRESTGLALGRCSVDPHAMSVCSVRQIQHGRAVRIVLRLLEEFPLLRAGEHLCDHGRPCLREPDVAGHDVGVSLMAYVQPHPALAQVQKADQQ